MSNITTRYKYRFLRVGEYPRKGDQFFRMDPPRWVLADADMLADWRGPVPPWYRKRYRRRIPAKFSNHAKTTEQKSKARRIGG